jgi:hypothetical protein
MQSLLSPCLGVPLQIYEGAVQYVMLSVHYVGRLTEDYVLLGGKAVVITSTKSIPQVSII